MSEKRFSWDGDILFDNLELRELGNCLEARDIADLLNEQQSIISNLKEENEKLRKQCFELEKDYVIETSDISDKIYLGDEIRELKQRYGVGDE